MTGSGVDTKFVPVTSTGGSGEFPGCVAVDEFPFVQEVINKKSRRTMFIRFVGTNSPIWFYIWIAGLPGALPIKNPCLRIQLF
jgi:hypothetical protein